MTYKPSSSSLTNQFWTQTTWFIDPQNVTGFASDNNTGLDATHPVLTFNGGVVAKWGTIAPHLAQNTNLTWLSSQVDASDPVVFKPTVINAVVTITGPLGAAQMIHSGALAGVVSKDRATAQLLEADLGFAAPIGTLIQNTTAGKASFAWVYKQVAGTVFALSQPLTPITLPVGFAATGAIAEVDTWANGDTFELFTPVGVNIVDIQCIPAGYISPDFPAPVQLQHITIISSDGVIGDQNAFVYNDVTVVECACNAEFIHPSIGDNEFELYANVFCQSGFIGENSDDVLTLWFGGVILSFDNFVAALSFDFDAILDTTGATTPGNLLGSSAWSGESGGVTVGTLYVAGALQFAGAIDCSASGFTVNPTIIWGPGALDTVGAARVFYNAARGALVTFLVPTLKLNGQTTAWAVTTGDPSIWHGGRAFSATQLDATIVGGGFGGLAVNIGGSAFTNQGTY